MLIILLSPVPERGLEVLRKVRRQSSGYLLAVGLASDSRFILRALHAGADLFLDETELETGLEAALSRLQNKETAAPGRRLIAVLACSGGSGASTLSVNIATVLAKDNQRCALIDLKPGRGDLAALLDLKPPFNLADLCLNVARLDRAMFEKVLTQHPSNVYLLASPQVFGGTRVVTAAGVSQALTMARKLFPHVVVDLEDCFHEEQVLTARQASVILLIALLQFTSLSNARILDHLREDSDCCHQSHSARGQPLRPTERAARCGGRGRSWCEDCPLRAGRCPHDQRSQQHRHPGLAESAVDHGRPEHCPAVHLTLERRRLEPHSAAVLAGR